MPKNIHVVNLSSHDQLPPETPPEKDEFEQVKEAVEREEEEQQPEIILVNEETKIDGIAPTLEALVKQEIKLDQLKKLFKCALQILEIS